MTKTEKVD